MILLEKASRKPCFLAMTVLRYVSTWWHLVGSWDGERHKFFDHLNRSIWTKGLSRCDRSFGTSVPFLKWSIMMFLPNLTWCGLEWQKDRMKWCNLPMLFMWSHFFCSTESRASLLNDCVLLFFFVRDVFLGVCCIDWTNLMGSLDLVGPLEKEIKLYIKPLPYYRPASFRFHFLDFKLLLSYKIRCFLPYSRMQMACHHSPPGITCVKWAWESSACTSPSFSTGAGSGRNLSHTTIALFPAHCCSGRKNQRERERESLLVGCVKFSRKPKIWEFTTKIKNIILKKRQGKSNHLTLGVFFFFLGGGGMQLQFLRSYPTPKQIIKKVNGSQDPCGYGWVSTNTLAMVHKFCTYPQKGSSSNYLQEFSRLG